MADKNTSTLQSYIDKAGAVVQDTIGSITGNPTDKAQAQSTRDKAHLEDAVSHAGTNIGGVSVSASGVAANNPDRQTGSMNQTIGSGKEAVGGLLGFEGLKKEGQQQNSQGKAQEAGGQLSDLGTGAADRLQGTVGGAVAGLTGDRVGLERAQLQHDQGKTLQRGAEADIQKQNS